MSTVGERQAGKGAGIALALDSGPEEAIERRRREQAIRLPRGEALAAAVVGGGFLAAALAVLWTAPADRHPSPLLFPLVVVLYALVSRVEFEIFDGASVPTQLVFVPMLFVLPLNAVPLAVCSGLLLEAAVRWAEGKRAGERIVLSFVSSWYAVGPVLVVWSLGATSLRWDRTPALAAALGAQFACELLAVSTYAWLAHRVSVRELAPHVLRGQAIDALLAVAGLAFAFAAQPHALGILLVLPLVLLLRVFADERRRRIDKALELSTAYRGTALLLGQVVEADDAYTGLHSREVVDLSVTVADALRVNAQERSDVELVALLHDVGKIRMPAEIVTKPGPLTPDERALMETHTVEGQRLLEQVGGLLDRIGRIVRSCHERWDGTGYPDGLAGEEIPRVARIVACCDAFSAMTSDRSYRRALPLAVALDEVRKNAGTQFDPEVASTLVALVERDGYLGSASTL